MFTYNVPGLPKAQPRPKVRTAPYPSVYYPGSIAKYKARVKSYFIYELENRDDLFPDDFPMAGPFRMDLLFKIPRAKSNHRAKRDYPPMYHEQVPDVDNLAKAVLDALEGLMYVNDCCCAELRIKKYFGEVIYDKMSGTHCNDGNTLIDFRVLPNDITAWL